MAIKTITYNDLKSLTEQDYFMNQLGYVLLSTYNISHTANANARAFCTSATLRYGQLCDRYKKLYDDTIITFNDETQNAKDVCEAYLQTRGMFTSLVKLFNAVDGKNSDTFDIELRTTKEHRGNQNNITELSPLGSSTTAIEYPTSKQNTNNTMTDSEDTPLDDYIKLLQANLPNIDTVINETLNSLRKDMYEVC